MPKTEKSSNIMPKIIENLISNCENNRPLLINISDILLKLKRLNGLERSIAKASLNPSEARIKEKIIRNKFVFISKLFK